MVIYWDTIECPKCGKCNLERERHSSSRQFREECTNCGYFHECTWGFDMTEEELVNMHFRRIGMTYHREGFIKKSTEKYNIVNKWFSSPSDIREDTIDWIDDKKE